MIANILSPEMIVVIVVAVVLFGGSQIPKLARGLGEASKEFKKATEEAEAASPKPPPPIAAAPPGEDKITMTKAELDALIAEREAQARRDATPGA
jgi:sec-independent protein translocase protein TatA